MAYGVAASVLQSWLDGLGNATNWTAPTEFWVKLHLGDPGAAGTANAALNTTRKQASFSAAGAGGTLTTDGDLAWTSVSNTESYSAISAWSASSGGTFLLSDDLASVVAVTAGNNFTIATGDIDIAITPVAA